MVLRSPAGSPLSARLPVSALAIVRRLAGQYARHRAPAGSQVLMPAAITLTYTELGGLSNRMGGNWSSGLASKRYGWVNAVGLG
jgi:hypothetical protein